MRNHPTVIHDEQLKLISGGLTLGNPYLDAGLVVIELAHAVLIAREITNFIGARWNSKPIEEGDYFTQFFANMYNYVTIR